MRKPNTSFALLVALTSGALVSSWPVTARAQISGVDDNIVSSNLDGSGYYALPTISGLGGDLTVEGWVYLKSYADYGRIADLGNGQAQDNIGLGTVGTTGRPLFFVDGLGGVEGPDALGLNTWVHVAGVIESDRTMRLYVNGNQVATGTASGDAPVVDRTSNYLGESNFAADALLNGGLADVRVWNTARSQAEIQANMPVGSIAGPTAGLVAAYAFGATGATPTADLSGNGHTATQNGNIGYSKFDTGTLATGGFSNAGATVDLNVAEGQLTITGTNSVNRLTVQNGTATQAAGSAVTTTGTGTDGSEPFQVGVSAGETGSYAMSGGTLDIANGGLAFIGASGTGTMTQTGGAVTTDGWTVTGRFGGSVGDYTISGGSLSHTSAATRIIVGEEGTGTLTIDGSGEVTTAGGISIAHGAGGVGTVNLEGGTLTTPGIAKGAGTSATLNMDGGTIVATGDNNNFMSGLDVAELKAGGGTIDDGGFQIVVGQALSGVGGLTKTGSGTMTLTGANTYSGATAINAGTLKLTAANDSSGYAIAAGSVLELSNDGDQILFFEGGTYTGEGTLRKSGSGDLIWRNDGSTVPSIALGSAATIDVQAGRMQASFDANQIWTNNQATLNVASGALFDVDAAAVRVSGLTGSGTIRLGLAGPFPEQKLTVGVANATSEFAGVIQDLNSSAPFEKVGTGTLTLSGNNTYTGGTAVNAGELKVNGSIAGSDVTVASGASLSGSGTVGAISGAGAINPGNSPGILTAPSVDPSGGLSFNFEFTSLNPVYSDASASLNDVLRLTDATPFVASLGAANTVNIYFNVDVFEEGQLYTGGFFTDTQFDFLNDIVGAGFNYYVQDAGGAVSYGGQSYSALGEGLAIELSTINQSGDFAGGTVDGQVVQFEVVPEPSTYALLVLGAAALGAHAWRRRRRAGPF